MAEGEKKHAASEHRRQQAREQGQLAKSTDLVSAVLLLAAIWTLDLLGPKLIDAIVRTMTFQLEVGFSGPGNSATYLRQMLAAMLAVAIGAVPIMGAMWGTAVVMNLGQTGFLWLPDKLGMDWSRVDPIAGAKRLFSLSNVTRLGFGLLKITLVGIVLVSGVWSRWPQIAAASQMELGQTALFVWQIIRDLILWTAGCLSVLAVADFAFQRWKYEQDLRMTDEEVREEMKSTQGDPQIKSRRRRIQRQMATQRLQSEVPKADVIITNPTELAIAIQYDPLTMKAPVVLAKGADLVAARIRRIALSSGVPVVERKPLAQALFKAVPIGSPVPVTEYAAVAEVLKYVYQLKGKTLPEEVRRAVLGS